MTSNGPGEVVAPVVESKIPRETRHITWNIADFADLKDTDGLVEKMGITFEMGREMGLPEPVTLKAYLRIFKDKEDAGGRKWIGVWGRAVLGAPPTGTSKVMGKIAIKIGDFYPRRCLKLKNLRLGNSFYRVIPQNVNVSLLPLDANGSLPIEITVTLYNTEGTRLTVNDVLAKFQPNFSRKLSEEMEMLYKEPQVITGIPQIVSVVARDGREFPANSSSLAPRSPVFRLMFQTPMKEVKEGVVRMEDIGGEALEVFLHFLHTATLKKNWKQPDVLEELIHAAHKYLMQDLLEFLDEAIGLVWAPENYTNMIRLAQLLELRKAKEALLKLYQDQWKQVSDDVEQMMELFQK